MNKLTSGDGSIYLWSIENNFLFKLQQKKKKKKKGFCGMQNIVLNKYEPPAIDVLSNTATIF